MLNFSCPHCHSDNTQKLSVLYASGQFTSHHSGSVGGMSGGGPVFGSYGGSSKSENLLSKQLAPPPFAPLQFHPLPWILVAVILSFTLTPRILGVLLVFAPPPLTATILLSVLVASPIAAWLAVRAFNSEQKRRYHKHYDPKRSQWERSYYCLRCGTVFEQN